MSGETVHQLLHGYRKGHELLAGSIRLSPADADLVTRLSDLSASLPAGMELTPYLTAYPVAASGLYALARTWADESAPRSGCVLTHTLLIPGEVWSSCPEPQQFAALFVFPRDSGQTASYQSPLQVDLGKGTTSESLAAPPEGESVDFVAKYFGEGLRPLIWVDCARPEETAWAIVRILWPALRAKFAWCTRSLQSRSLDDRPFDLQFAPSVSYSRFHNVPRENLISSQPASAEVRREPWCVPFAKWVFGAPGPGPIEYERKALGRSSAMTRQ